MNTSTFGRRSMRRLSRCLFVIVSLILLSGCLPDGNSKKDSAKQDRSDSSPTQDYTGEQITRNRKSSLLPEGKPDNSETRESRLAKKSQALIDEAMPTNARGRIQELIRFTDPDADIPAGRGSKVALNSFFKALSDLETGSRKEPVTILHLGDDHISSDQITNELRKKFQERFGDSGRGLVMPGFPFPYYRADGILFDKSGEWVVSNSQKEKDPGPFGITGIVLRSGMPGAKLSAELKSSIFSWVEIAILTGESEGTGIASVHGEDGQTRNIISSAGPPGGVRIIRFDQPGRKLEIVASDEKPLSIVSIRFGNEQPGLRYINLGLPGATLNILRKMDGGILKEELGHLKPDLIVLGYGTNEAQNDAFDEDRYRARYIALIDGLKVLAPGASVVVMGPPDLARLPKYVEKEKAASGNIACRHLSELEQENYNSLVRRKDPKLRRWHSPPKWDSVRKTLQGVAGVSGSYFWDWSRLMGGACGSHTWTHASPPLMAPDHVRLTENGAKKTAEALFNEIISNYSDFRKMALPLKPSIE